MSIPDSTAGKGSVKTLAIRLEPDLHAQLSLIAHLRGSTITDEIRQAIEAHVALIGSSTDLAQRADSVLEDIEREAAARREAITNLFGTQPATGNTDGRSRGRRSATPTDRGNLSQGNPLPAR